MSIPIPIDINAYPNRARSGCGYSLLEDESVPIAQCARETQIPNSRLPSTDAAVETHVTTATTPSRRSGRNRRRIRARDSCCQDFFDQYELLDGPESILGEGAFGSVRLCRHKTSGREFAVKIIDREYPQNTREKCVHEMRLMMRCKSEGTILQMHEFYEDKSHFYMVNEYIAGGNLQTHLEEQKHLDEYSTALMVRDLATALAFLHKNCIAHRDIKPANILCCSRDGPSPCKIADFDLATSADIGKSNALKDSGTSGHGSPARSPGHYRYSSESGDEHARPDSPRREIPIMEMNSAVGSPEYMAPEIARLFLEDEMSVNKYSQACDIWSLGVIMYTALSGGVPFRANPYDCDADQCRWEQGEACSSCVNSLFEQICDGKLVFRGEKWDSISDSAKHLVYSCLTKNQYDRITADEILEHPFIQTLSTVPNLPQTASPARGPNSPVSRRNSHTPISFLAAPIPEENDDFLEDERSIGIGSETCSIDIKMQNADIFIDQLKCGKFQLKSSNLQEVGEILVCREDISSSIPPYEDDCGWSEGSLSGYPYGYKMDPYQSAICRNGVNYPYNNDYNQYDCDIETH